MDSIYIETSIVSHATAWPSSDPNTALLQQQARDWWDNERAKFRVVTSQLVIDEGGVQYLLTQNCRHIANGHTLPRVYKTLDELGFPDLLIYTPAVFLGGGDDNS